MRGRDDEIVMFYAAREREESDPRRRRPRSLLLYLRPDNIDDRRKMKELNMLIRELKLILYGDSDCEPSEEACAKLSQEFLKEDTMRLLIFHLPNLDFEACKDASQVASNILRQPLPSRLHASRFLEANLDLVDCLISGYEDPRMGLHYGGVLRECIRHQTVACYVLEPEQMKKFFEYVLLPSFDISADATATFEELLTRHKSTVSGFLLENYDWFFADYNAKLLESANYITRRQAVKLLGRILLDCSNSAVMIRYVSSKDNLMILMNLLRESSKSIRIDAFQVFKLFVANENKPPDIINILFANKSKLLRIFSCFELDTADESLQTDKDQVVKEIAELELKYQD